MNALPFAFAYPAILGTLVALPVIWWLLRLTPPRPKTEVFPPLKILASVLKREDRLDQTGQARGGLGVADVGLHRSDEAGAS